MAESEVAQLRKKMNERVDQLLPCLRRRLAIWRLRATRLGHEALESYSEAKAVCIGL